MRVGLDIALLDLQEFLMALELALDIHTVELGAALRLQLLHHLGLVGRDLRRCRHARTVGEGTDKISVPRRIADGQRGERRWAR